MKNLIYFIYYSGSLNHYHFLNLGLLKEYWKIFDGEKIVKIAVDSDYDLTPLIDLLPPDINFEVVKNDPELGESIHFIDSISRIKKGLTFYAHCKGVSRSPMEGLDRWIENLYKLNLNHVPELREKAFAGICGKLLDCSPYVPYPFHYSGSFYWFNPERLKRKELIPNRYLSERFPAIMADQEDCIFNHPSFYINLNYYSIETWNFLESR